MFGIGMPEMLIILAVALIVIGPSKLPDLAKSLGRALGEFKKATSDLKSSLEIDQGMNDVKQVFDDVNKDIRDAVYPDTDTKSAMRPGGDEPDNVRTTFEEMSKKDSASEQEKDTEAEKGKPGPDETAKKTKPSDDGLKEKESNP